MSTPLRIQRVEQINFGLSQGRLSINAIASLLPLSLHIFRVLFFSFLDLSTNIMRKKKSSQ